MSPNDSVRKPGWQVRSSIVEAVRRAVQSGAATSQNAFVEQALIRALKDLRRDRVYSAYAEAAADEAFQKEMAKTSAAFDSAAGDGLGQ